MVIPTPERSPGVVEGHCDALVHEIERGSLLQVNQWSLTGGHGAEAEAAGLALLRRGLVAVLASGLASRLAPPDAQRRCGRGPAAASTPARPLSS